MGQVSLRPGAWWVLRILTGTENSDYLLFNPSTHTSVIWYLFWNHIRIGSAFGPTIAAGYSLIGNVRF